MANKKPKNSTPREEEPVGVPEAATEETAPEIEAVPAPEAAPPEAAAEPDAEALLEAERDKFLRLAAEYDNFRKRSSKELLAQSVFIRADTVTRLLPVYDNLARALEAPCADESFYKGVEMTMTQFTEILASLGVEEIKAAGEPFDPEKHNAVSQVSEDGIESGIITAEFQKGFTLDGKVIRHSVVQVNS